MVIRRLQHSGVPLSREVGSVALLPTCFHIGWQHSRVQSLRAIAAQQVAGCGRKLQRRRSELSDDSRRPECPLE